MLQSAINTYNTDHYLGNLLNVENHNKHPSILCFKMEEPHEIRKAFRIINPHYYLDFTNDITTFKHKLLGQSCEGAEHDYQYLLLDEDNLSPEDMESLTYVIKELGYEGHVLLLTSDSNLNHNYTTIKKPLCSFKALTCLKSYFNFQKSAVN